MKRGTLFFTTLIMFATCIYGQDTDDFLGMSMEDLMNVRVKEVSLPDIPHVHGKNEFMFSYQLMSMRMDNHLLGRESLSAADVLGMYMITPTNMTMNMHMIHAMYAASDRLSIMLMWSYVTNSMDHLARNGNTFTTDSKGVSDLKLGALYTLWQHDQSRLTGLLGVRLPLGGIEAMDVTPLSAPNETILPYPMQLGSGTVDPLLGLTYLKAAPKYGYGLDARLTPRIMDNSNNYRLGNEFMLTSWYSKLITDDLSMALQGVFHRKGDISGADERLNPMMVYTADPDLRGGHVVKMGLVITIHPQSLPGWRLAFDARNPVYQDLHGPQLQLYEELKVALTYVTGQK